MDYMLKTTRDPLPPRTKKEAKGQAAALKMLEALEARVKYRGPEGIWWEARLKEFFEDLRENCQVVVQ